MQRIDLTDEFKDDFGLEPESTGVILGPTSFEAEKPLKPNQVYCAAIGVFEANHFSLCYRFMGQSIDGQVIEKGRIYQKSAPTGRLYILYYPGKDNENPITIEDTTESLSTTVKTFNQKIIAEYSRSALENAKKIYIVGESNTYLGFSVAHYIKATLFDNLLTTEDSIDRDYDESYITNLIPHIKRKTIKHGWQNMVTDHWSCGHYVINAIERDITDEQAPAEFSIDEKIIEKHSSYYNIGFKASKESFYSNSEKDDINYRSLGNINYPININNLNENVIDDYLSYSSEESFDISKDITMIPVSGKTGFYAENCYLSAARFANTLQENYDANLEIIPVNLDDERIYKVYTNKNIPAFENIGLRKIQDDNGFLFYALNVKRHVPTTKDPLFGICVSVNDSTRTIGIPDVFTANEIKDFITEAKNNRQQQNIQNGTLQHIKTMNRYLSIRAKETPGFWGSLTGRYSGHDYYKRRNSWKKILEKFNAHCSDNENVTKESLITFIETELDQFKPGFFSFLHRTNRYHTCLKNLLDKLNQSNDDLSELEERVTSYCQIYNQMDKYRILTQSYVNHFSVFSPKGDHASKTREKSRALYQAQLDMLSEEDKNDFLPANKAHKTEYKNTTYHARW